MYFRRQLLIIGILILGSTVSAPSAVAWDWLELPAGLSGGADLVGEVLEVRSGSLVLEPSGGPATTIRLAPECEITLNGMPVAAAALRPVAPGSRVEVRVCLQGERAVSVAGFYCCLEAEVLAIKGQQAFCKPLNSSTGDKWLELPGFPKRPQVGEVYLLILDSAGKVKRSQRLGPLEENSYR
ncbi:MAG: hypothetical protein H0Z38_00865 [Firmicutes bacterium]|nr:hypothetical protein [Bacillota bacterium]